MFWIKTPNYIHFRCIHELYSADLPSVSVIIIFHNEHLSTLLRTCYSVWNRTPVKLLTEIILVDDASTIEDLGNDLGEYIEAYMPIVKLIRLEKRSGLIKARIEGAKIAKSETLVFLDSHCEAYHNWLPPLLGKYISWFVITVFKIVTCLCKIQIANYKFPHSRCNGW